MTEEILSHERLTSILVYESESGMFTWKDSRKMNRVKGVAGSLKPECYRFIKIDGRSYSEHRLAWFYVYKVFPPNQVDHINRIRHDNRIVNLRLVTKSENSENTLLNPNNKSGFRGVSWNKALKKWNAKIGHKNKKFHLGYFNEISDAILVYKKAASVLHKFNPYGE